MFQLDFLFKHLVAEMRTSAWQLWINHNFITRGYVPRHEGVYGTWRITLHVFLTSVLLHDNESSASRPQQTLWAPVLVWKLLHWSCAERVRNCNARAHAHKLKYVNCVAVVMGLHVGIAFTKADGSWQKRDRPHEAALTFWFQSFPRKPAVRGRRWLWNKNESP
jgi:hypothetical protein